MRIPKRAHVETLAPVSCAHGGDACAQGTAAAAAVAAPVVADASAAVLKPRFVQAASKAAAPSPPAPKQQQPQSTNANVLIDAGLATRLPPGALERAQAALRNAPQQNAALLAAAAEELCAGLGPDSARVLRLPPHNQPHVHGLAAAAHDAWQVPLLSAAHGAGAAAAALLVPRLDGGDNGSSDGATTYAAVEAAAAWHLNVLQQIDAVGWGCVLALSKVRAADSKWGCSQALLKSTAPTKQLHRPTLMI
jgi:hypothetical protein